MHHFETELTAGSKAPYTTWTFLVVPEAVATELGPGRHPVRGELAGAPFRGTLSRGEGLLRMPVPADLRERLGVGPGDVVTVRLELDPEPRPVEIPGELEQVLDSEPDLAALFAALPPSHQRAWAAHVGEAKREATRLRRAAKAAEGIRGRLFPGQIR